MPKVRQSWIQPIFAVVEQMLQYPGGYKEFEKYVLKRLNKEPTELALRDRVQVVFIIDKSGAVQNARIGIGGE
ncbi:hypothetical protein Q0590_35845 [Rhodocytophaga aerolata]|uniref:TonB C-terminal domain-containing protein n=1 Tax=Rhodocytophaga aerolata TaxID=455078 RepID=A0ABT8RHW8_9BACT|nr:hypothetical protein [Rhodocytophaga aerolata]MDO1451702.1 hypothetical protein [Rhodocytophaga aerolata]